MSLAISLMRFLPRPRHVVQGAVLLPVLMVPAILLLGPTSSIALGTPEYVKLGTRCQVQIPLANHSEAALEGLTLKLVWEDAGLDWQGNPLNRELDISAPYLDAGQTVTLTAPAPLPERCDVYETTARKLAHVEDCTHATLQPGQCRRALRSGSDAEQWTID